MENAGNAAGWDGIDSYVAFTTSGALFRFLRSGRNIAVSSFQLVGPKCGVPRHAGAFLSFRVMVFVDRLVVEQILAYTKQARYTYRKLESRYYY